jgi:hypothetical protein
MLLATYRRSMPESLAAAARTVARGMAMSGLLAPALAQMTDQQRADFRGSNRILARVEAAIRTVDPGLVALPRQPEATKRVGRRGRAISLLLALIVFLGLLGMGVWKLVDLSKELVASTADRAMRGESVAPLGSPFLPRPIAVEASLLPAPNERAQVTGLDYYAEGLFRRGCLLYLGESGGRVVVFGPLRSALAGQTDTSSHSSYRLDANELPPLEPCNGANGGAGTVRTSPP